jgi:hypothetical protein
LPGGVDENHENPLITMASLTEQARMLSVWKFKETEMQNSSDKEGAALFFHQVRVLVTH